MLGTWPYWKPSRTDLKSSPASRVSWRTRRKSGLRELKSLVRMFYWRLTCLLESPGAVLGGDNPNVDPLLGGGGDGEVAELTLLHPDVPVGVDLLTSEPFLPEQYIFCQ